MPLPPGTRLGPYIVAAPLGAGGMGEVYRARDSKLDRDVALKVLPAAFAADPERIARFEREAKVLASLNHPHIAHVYDAGRHELPGQPDSHVAYLAMELVDGEDLTARIERGPIPLDAALSIAREIASALDAAHAVGVIHRDLKPANIKLTREGQVKVLDFGLAKAMQAGAASGEAAHLDQSPANSPTLTARATQLGMIIGTAAYMAPEQARGRSVDKRADIWAFGCVLWEMLTGRRLFAGDDLTDVLAAVVKDEPDFGAIPVEVRRLVRRCLEKDPRKRLRDIGDAWDLLDDQRAAALPGAPRGSTILPWALAAAAVVAAGWLSFIHILETPDIQAVTTFRLSWPVGPAGDAGGAKFVTLSPDGRHVALVSQDALWVRSLDAIDPVRLERTEGATYPFWSPDSAQIAFFAGDQLKRIARTGGPVQAVTAAPDGRGGTWNQDGVILYSDKFGEEGLKRVAEAGGTPATVTTLTSKGTSDAQRYPQFLPDGIRFLYLHLTGDAAIGGVYLGALDGTAPVRLLDGQDSALYSARPSASDGYLLVRRQGALMAQAFDPARGTLTGEMFPVMEGVGQGENTGLGAVSVSDSGNLVVWSGISTLARLTWIDRAGNRRADVSPVVDVDAFSVSGDGRLALSIREGGINADIWTTALDAYSPSKFTFGPQPGWTFPLWSHDASAVAYATFDLAGLQTYEIRRKRSDMTGTEETLAKTSKTFFLWDWGPDGTSLVFSQGADLWQLRLAGNSDPVRLTTGPADEQYGQVSPDGRFLAYAAAERGPTQVYVQPMVPTGALWLVSTDGGNMPRWRRDGSELYYRGADGRLMAVPVSVGPGGSFVHGAPKALFGPIPTVGNVDRFTYQPSPDGQQFLVAVPLETSARPMTVVLNWQQMIGR